MVVVGTWNVENLYRPGGEFGPTTQAAYEEKLDRLAATINRLGPDVLAVQEVGQPEAVAGLVERLEGQWTTVLSEHPDVRGIRVGFISKLEVTSTEHVVLFPHGLAPVQVGDDDDTSSQMGRGAVHVRVNAASGSLDLVTAHLKSKLLTYPGGQFQPDDEDQRARFAAYALFRRAAEAATLRVYANTVLDGQGQDAALIVLGDLNDTPMAATTQLLYGPSGSQFDTGGFSHPDKGDAWRLWNLAPRIPLEHRYTRIFEGQPELIDHILISHALLDRLQTVDADVSGLGSIAADPTTRQDASASDHAPVIATFID